MNRMDFRRPHPRAPYVVLAVLGIAIAWGVEVVGFLLPATLAFMAFRAMAGVGLTLIMGYSGQAVLGHAAFFGMGAYAELILVGSHGWPMALATVVGMLTAALVGGLLGRLVFGLSGHFLAMATLAFGLIFVNLVQWAKSVTGGNNGATVPPIGFGSWRLGKDPLFGIDPERVYFLIAWACVLGLLWLANGIIHSRHGRALIALRSSPTAAGASGIDTVRARTAVFMLGAAIAAFAGSLYAHFIGFISPDSFTLLVSIEMVVLVTLGGLRSIWGAPVGAIGLMVLVEGTRAGVGHFTHGSTAAYEVIAYGLAIVIVMLLAPDGLVGIGRSISTLRPASVTTPTTAPNPTTPAPAATPAPVTAAGAATGDVPPILSADSLTIRFGGVVALDGVTLDVAPATVTAVIGPNGAGKTTMFNVLSGVIAADSGSLTFQQRVVTDEPLHLRARGGMARTFQNLELFDGATVADTVLVGRDRHATSGLLAAALRLPNARREERIDRDAVEEILRRFDLSEFADRVATDLPYGVQRRVELARAVAAEPDLLFLDEPMAGLTGPESAAIARSMRALADDGMTIVVVEHHVEAVLDVADQVIVLDRGRVIANGIPHDVRNSPQVREAYLGVPDA